MSYTISIKGKLFDYFQQRLRLKKSTKSFYRGNCLWCGGNYTMGVSVEANKVHCFKCLEKMSCIDALMKIEGFETYNEAKKFINVQQEYEAYDRMFRDNKKVEYKQLNLPESFNLITQGEDIYARSARNYLGNKRKFNIRTLAKRGVGYCNEGEYAGYIIFPFYIGGELRYFQGRRYLGSGPKMKNPPEEEYGIGKSKLIYNQDALFIYNRVYIMESITNCLTLGDATSALLGKTISQYQLSKVVEAPCKKIIIILDNDAWEQAIDMAMQTCHYKKVKLIHLPTSEDVNDLGKTKTLEIVKKEPYKKYMDFFRMRLDLK